MCSHPTFTLKALNWFGQRTLLASVYFHFNTFLIPTMYAGTVEYYPITLDVGDYRAYPVTSGVPVKIHNAVVWLNKNFRAPPKAGRALSLLYAGALSANLTHSFIVNPFKRICF